MSTHKAPPHAGPIALPIDCKVIAIPFAAPLWFCLSAHLGFTYAAYWSIRSV
ncbi:hypothetical protein HanPSC8_Chr09g0376171 [Helianthus annuus]|nr:hypothetical protein HanPSC8_Chr09g0376171 [Helianthus annuus]